MIPARGCRLPPVPSVEALNEDHLLLIRLYGLKATRHPGTSYVSVHNLNYY